jgi:cellulose biosynthesis protein BcsQ
MDDTAFYVERIKHFDDERRLFNEYISLVHISPKESHMLGWETRQITEEINSAESQKKSSELELTIASEELERKRRELEEVRGSQGSRQQQIELLSQLSQPVEHDFTYIFTDKYPSASKKGSVTGKVISDVANASGGHGGIGIKKLQNGEVIMMEKKLNEISSSCTSIVHRIIENSVISEEDLKFGHDDLIEQLSNSRVDAAKLITDVNRWERQSFSSVAELLRLRLRIMIAQREEVEEVSELHREKENFAMREKVAREQLLDDAKSAKKRLAVELKHTADEFNLQLVRIDKKIEKAKELEKKIDIENQHIVSHSGSALETRLKAVKER